MDFNEALIKLKIEDFKDRILSSNSKGELMHCYDYITFATSIPETMIEDGTFRNIFIEIVSIAERTWDRPESVFQHIITILKQNIHD